MPVKRIQLNPNQPIFNGGIPATNLATSLKGEFSNWDFNADGDISAFDLSVFEIGVVMQEEHQKRKAEAAEILEKLNTPIELNKTSGTPKKTSFRITELTKSLQVKFLQAALLHKNNRGASSFSLGQISKKGSSNIYAKYSYKDVQIGPVSFVSRGPTAAKYKGNRKKPGVIDAINDFLNKNSEFNDLDINSIVENNAQGNTLKTIIEDCFLYVGEIGGSREAILDVLDLSDPDAYYQPIYIPETSVVRSIAPYNIHTLDLDGNGFGKGSLYQRIPPGDPLNPLYKDNYLYKSSDSFDQRVNKFRNYLSGVYLNYKILGVPDFLNELKDLRNNVYPIPQIHATYDVINYGSDVITSEYNVDSDELATTFAEDLDIAYVAHNIQNFKMPKMLQAVQKIISLSVGRNDRNGNPLTEVKSVKSINFRSKEIADLISAIGDGSTDNYIIPKYDLNNHPKLGVDFAINPSDQSISVGGLRIGKNNTFPDAGRARRQYSDRQIISGLVWKLIKCGDPSEIYFAYANEFYDFSLSGLFQYAHYSSYSSDGYPLPDNENLFLNKKVGDMVSGVYYLYNFTGNSLEDYYTENLYGKGSYVGNDKKVKKIFPLSYKGIEEDSSVYFYDQSVPESQETGVPVGCYKIYLNEYPYKMEDGKKVVDYDRIWNYTSLPHYWESTHCKSITCMGPPPPPTPSPSITPSISISPTPSITKSMSVTPSVTKTASPTSTPDPTITPTSSNTKTPTPSPSISRTSTATPSSTRTPSITRTPTRTITVTNSPSKTTTPTETPPKSLTPTPSITRTPSVTRTPTKSITPTSTPPKSQTPTPSITPSITETASVTPTQCLDPKLDVCYTVTPTQSVSKTATCTPTPPPSITPTSTPPKSKTPTPSLTKTSSVTPTPPPSKTPPKSKTPTPTVTRTPPKSKTPTPSLTKTPSNTPDPSKTPSVTATPPPTKSPTRTPSNTPDPSKTPSVTATPPPSKTATRTPTTSLSRTPPPSVSPSLSLSMTPTETPPPSKTPTPSPIPPDQNCAVEFITEI